MLRAAGVKEEDFDKPFIAVCNSYIDIVPGHVHLQEFGKLVKEAIREAGGVPFEFNTIGVDDGIAMGHIGMRYSLPSREIIADSFETVVSAHWFDGAVCIPNCDKITPGMMMGALRVNIPTMFVSGGPMKAGKDRNGRSISLTSVFEASALISRQNRRADADRAGAVRLSYLRFLFGHVHSEFHELSGGGLRFGASGQRYDSGCRT